MDVAPPFASRWCRSARSTSCYRPDRARRWRRTSFRPATSRNRKCADQPGRPGGAVSVDHVEQQRCAGCESRYRPRRSSAGAATQRPAAAGAFYIEEGDLFPVRRPTRTRGIALQRRSAFRGFEPSAFAVQSWGWALVSPAVEKKAMVLESGAQAGSLSTRSALSPGRDSRVAVPLPSTVARYSGLGLACQRSIAPTQRASRRGKSRCRHKGRSSEAVRSVACSAHTVTPGRGFREEDAST